MQMFDVNGDGELDRTELTAFIASHVKMAFKAGLMPTQEFFDDGSLEISQIESLLETRCKDMLKGYFSLDKDADGTYVVLRLAVDTSNTLSQVALVCAVTRGTNYSPSSKTFTQTFGTKTAQQYAMVACCTRYVVCVCAHAFPRRCV